ncbi:hypothetical protein [Pedobacter panaciterrae]
MELVSKFCGHNEISVEVFGRSVKSNIRLWVFWKDSSVEFKNDEVIDQVTGKFSDGTTTKFDNIVVDSKTGKVKLVNETKTGNAKLSKQQKRYHKDGESVELTGGNAKDAAGTTVNKNSTNTRVSRVKKEDIKQ